MSVTHALVKLSVASAGHGWVVTTIDLCNMVALDVGDFVHGEVAGKGNLREDRSRTTKETQAQTPVAF